MSKSPGPGAMVPILRASFSILLAHLAGRAIGLGVLDAVGCHSDLERVPPSRGREKTVVVLTGDLAKAWRTVRRGARNALDVAKAITSTNPPLEARAGWQR